MTEIHQHYQVELEQQPIELYKLLKIANLVAGGGEAKIVISQGYVLLNGEPEYQKRKKIFAGDIIEFNGDLVELICHQPPAENFSATTKPKKPASSKANHTPAKNKQEQPSTAGKRRPIRF